jgi:hypothetical protein
MVSPTHVAGMVDEGMRKLRARIAPLGGEGDAWDVAAAAVFLASDGSRFITAVCLPVDGGATEILPLSAHGLLEGRYEKSRDISAKTLRLKKGCGSFASHGVDDQWGGRTTVATPSECATMAVEPGGKYSTIPAGDNF